VKTGNVEVTKDVPAHVTTGDDTARAVVTSPGILDFFRISISDRSLKGSRI
jgi:hypothetical protein